MVLVRVGLPLTVLFDLWEVWRLHLILPLWGPGDAGGMGKPEQREKVAEIYRWFEPVVATTHGAFWLLVAANVAIMLGFCTPLACVAAVLIEAQFALVLPPADRGIDMMIRNVTLILAFAQAGRMYGLDAALFGHRDRVPAWPRRLLVLQLSVMYFAAGVQKAAVAWWPWGGFSALFLILQDMAIARFPFAWLAHLYPLTQLLTASTMVFEWGASLVPLAVWYRATRTRAGWLRAQLNRLGFVRLWLPFGLLMHLGIAATMQIGIFPWAMLAMYWAFFHPDELAAAFGALRRRLR
jgi:hypothetical protein